MLPMGFMVLQKVAVSISPEWEHRAILQGKEVKRFQVSPHTDPGNVKAFYQSPF